MGTWLQPGGDTGTLQSHDQPDHPPMIFAKRLRPGIREGRINATVRIWHRPRVKVGGIYPMEDGHVVVRSIREISLSDVTGELARETGFEGLIDLLKVARHGSGSNVYLIRFDYVGPSHAP